MTKRPGRKRQGQTQPKRNIVVIELSGDFKRRTPERPHVYITATSKDPNSLLSELAEGKGPRWISGRVKTIRPDLVLKYQPTSSSDAIKRRLIETRRRLSSLGFAVNGDACVWRLYVLDVNPDTSPVLLERGKLNKVIYVGQTSKDVSTRVLEHQGLALSKRKKFLGAPSIRGRSPRLNSELTPTELYFSEGDAKKAEAKYSKKLKDAGYRVLGDGLTNHSRRNAKGQVNS